MLLYLKCITGLQTSYYRESWTRIIGRKQSIVVTNGVVGISTLTFYFNFLCCIILLEHMQFLKCL
jgi:hypothetical protein